MAEDIVEREHKGFKIRPSLSGLYAVAQAEGGSMPSSISGHFTGVDYAMRAIDNYVAGIQENLETIKQKSRKSTKSKDTNIEDVAAQEDVVNG